MMNTAAEKVTDGGVDRWSPAGDFGSGELGWFIEAHGTDCSTGERWRRAVIGKLFVMQRLIGAGPRVAVLADSSSLKTVLHEEDVKVVLLPGMDDVEGWWRWPATARSKAQGAKARVGGVDVEEANWKR
jgi:hypothetical protein